MKMGIRKGNKPGCHVRKAYAHGGRVHKANGGGISGGDEASMFMDDDADQANMVDGVPVRQRLDRPAPKSGKATNITINVAAPKAEPAPLPPKVPPVVPPGIPPMAGAPPAPPMMPPPGGPNMPMRKNGGRVGKMDGGTVRSEDEYHKDQGTDWGAAKSEVKRFFQGKPFGSTTQSEPDGGPGSGKRLLENQKARRNVTTPSKRANGGRVEGGAGGGLGRLEEGEGLWFERRKACQGQMMLDLVERLRTKRRELGLCPRCGLPDDPNRRGGTADSNVNVLEPFYCPECKRNKYGNKDSGQ